MNKSAAEAFLDLYNIIARLRGPGGCPWDREQTPQTLRNDLVEETYECVEAVSENDPAHVKEELGDLYQSLTLLAYIFEQQGGFTVSDVLEGVCEKLVRRHPHVFAGKEVSGTAEVLENWAKIKTEQEGRKPKDSILDEVKSGLPPLERANLLQKKAAKAGYDWTDLNGVFAKVDEELGEVKDALKNNPGSLEEELGDFLFMAVNLCRFLNVDPSAALLMANSKFYRRFGHIEKRMKETGMELKKENLALMDSYWDEAKTSG